MGAKTREPMTPAPMTVEAVCARVIHRRRGAENALETQIVTESLLTLDPPGISVDIAGSYAFDA